MRLSAAFVREQGILRMENIRMNRAVWALLVASAMSTSVMEPAQAQAPAPVVHATLNQLMRGTFYPASNVFFAAQDLNPADVPRAKDPNMATDPLTTVFGKWEAVDNSALVIADLADLLMRPGQKCSNGLDVPVGNADWARFVQGLREAAMAAYAAAQTRNQDKIIDAAGVMSTACANCHVKYREKKLADRCK
jgi:hypothetical protein